MLAAMPFPEEFGGFRRLPKALTPARASEPGGDAHNPEFQGSGRAERQWELTVAACRVPGLLRRLSWQRVMAVAAGAPELAYLAGRPHSAGMSCSRSRRSKARNAPNTLCARAWELFRLRNHRCRWFEGSQHKFHPLSTCPAEPERSSTQPRAQEPGDDPAACHRRVRPRGAGRPRSITSGAPPSRSRHSSSLPILKLPAGKPPSDESMARRPPGQEGRISVR